MEIRAARPEEYAVVGELVVDAYATLPGGYVLGDYVDELRDVAHRAVEAEVLVAVDDHRVLGTVTFAAGGPYVELGGPDDGEFRMLAVSDDARGGGVGRALVQACIDRSRQLGRRRVVLSSQPAMTRAHRLYESLGFRRTPELDWEPEAGILLLAFALDL